VFQRPARAAAAATGGIVPSAAPEITGKRILVVDDEPLIRRLVAETLSVHEHHVDTATDGADALARLDSGSQYDAIISDIRMPRMDGLQFYREVERRDPNLPRRMVFVTGNALGPALQAFLAETRAPLLRKPFPLQDMLAMVQQVLRAGTVPRDPIQTDTAGADRAS
jgi:CheY-like chemotaxis protein